jgi:cobalt-zinc-cadmium efflux system membrane fusion protein
MNKLITLAGVLCVIFASCNDNNTSDAATGITFKGDTVYLSEESIIHSRIKLLTVEPKNFSAEFNTTGSVKAISGQLAEIAPSFDGRITKSYIKLGQKVNAGTPLFEMYSVDFSEAVKNYFQTQQTMKMKESNLKRQQDLVENGVGVAKELEEAETDYEVALADYENAVSKLKVFNINTNEISMGQALKVVSPIAGEVVKTNIVIGQYVRSDAEALAIIAELSAVWVVAQVKEKNIASIRKDDNVEIRTDANPEQIVKGHISHISELLDEETRSVQVLIVCDNKDRKLKPGMFTSVHFISAPEESVVIPSKALLQREDRSYVFVKDTEGRYVRRYVDAVTANGRELLITRGLKTGDVIVSEGGIYLMGD